MPRAAGRRTALCEPERNSMQESIDGKARLPSAEHGRLNCDTIADADVGDCVAHLDNNAGRLVPQN